MRILTKKLKSDRGGAMLIALVMMGMMALIGIMAVNNSNNDMDMSFNAVHSDEAFYVAEAGAKQAISELQTDIGWRDGYTAVSFGGGNFTVTVTDNTADSTLADTILLNSTGEVDGASSTIQYAVLSGRIYPFGYAMFADKGIALDKNTCTDSFNSDSGTYATTVLNELGDVGSNTSVTSSKEVDFGGSITVATPGGIALGASNTVSGDTTSTADSVNLDLIPDAEYTWAAANNHASTGLSGGGYAYNSSTKSLVAGSYANIEFTSGVYYFSEITLGQGSTITLAPGAEVTIYVTGDIHLSQSSTVNDGGSPAALMVYSKGSNLQFDQGNTFVGAFYGPNAHIQYDQTTEVYGALVGGSIKLDQGACFHYDRHLGQVSRSGNSGVEILAWREIQ